jgi:hypothetical protein
MTENDLHLLASTVDYFTRMRAQVSALGPIVRKLEKTAAVLLCLAQRHVALDASRAAQANSSSIVPDNVVHQSTTMSVEGTAPGGGAWFADQFDTTSFADDINMDDFISWLPQDMAPRLDVDGTANEGNFDGGHDSHMRGIAEDDGSTSQYTFDWFSWDAKLS